MATQETQQLDSIIASRRSLLLGGGALAGLALASGIAQAAVPAAPTDADILNFALNLEYLEAQFYTLATEGVYADKSATTPITVGATGSSSATNVITKGGGASGAAIKPVPFTNSFVKAYALETALEERKHVNFLRTALGTAAVAQPNLDLYNSFLFLGGLVGVTNYDPFANDLYFLLGAYIFEDVGVTAYHGAAALITDTASYLLPAAEIQAVEAYHAGLIRSSIYGVDQGSIILDPANPTLGKGVAASIATKISNVRATVDGTINAKSDDVGVGNVSVALNGTTATYTSSTITNADANSIAFARTPQQVLNIVYASATGVKGGFYPAGLNGNIN
jgi:hypothetical protein